MKINFTRTLVLLTAIVFFYASCKKNEIKSVAKPPTIDYKALSSQIALNLAQSLTGKYGGTNINDGISLPKSLNRNVRGLAVNSINMLCGFIVDTAFNNKFTVNDTTKTNKGNFHFVFNCDAGVLDGYIVSESFTSADSGYRFTDYNSAAQSYVVKALDSTYKLVSMNGTINVDIQNTFYVTPDPSIARGDQGSHVLSSQYVLTGLNVNFSSGIADITTGTATFTTSTFDLNSTTAIDGTNSFLSGEIVFLGNHKAQLNFSGFYPPLSFMVDLLTGAVTKI